MKGALEEGRRSSKAPRKGIIRDAALIAASQRVEHYEMAGYGSAREFAKLLVLSDVARLLDETLAEEKMRIRNSVPCPSRLTPKRRVRTKLPNARTQGLLHGSAAFVLFFVLAGCSSSHFLTHDDLESKSRAAISLAAEAETFLTHLNQHTYSQSYVTAHLLYLQKQGIEIENDIRNVSVEADDVTRLRTLVQATTELSHSINRSRSLISNTPARSASVATLRSIRQRLEADMPR